MHQVKQFKLSAFFYSDSNFSNVAIIIFFVEEFICKYQGKI